MAKQPSGAAKFAAVVFGGIIGIPMAVAALGLVSILLPPALLLMPLAVVAGWVMGYQAIIGGIEGANQGPMR